MTLRLDLSLVHPADLANVLAVNQHPARLAGVDDLCRNGDLVFLLQNIVSSSLTMRLNKLEGLPLETLSSRVLEFEGKARANPIRGPFTCFLLG